MTDADLSALFDGARLTALRDLDILDTEPEEAFDRFTSLVTEMLGVPVSLITLVDDRRQFMKSHHGLGTEPVARDAPFSHSFCKHTVATQAPLVVEDTRVHDLLKDNLGVRDAGVIAYAGVPLTLGDGQTVGTLCALDHRPRRWSDRDVRILTDLAGGVQGLLEMRRRVAEQSLYDALTGLPGRGLLAALHHQLSGGAPQIGRPAVVAVGVDGMGLINGAYGVQVGDRILRTIGERLAGVTRPADVLGRAAGDVFLVLCPGVSREDDARMLAQRLRATVSSASIPVGDDSLSPSVTAGIAIPDEHITPEDLFARAAEAMREAKDDPGHVHVADTRAIERAGVRLRLRGALGGAVARDEIAVAFQPIVDLESGQVRAVEALARWTHPVLGSVPPGDFIPVAEATGDIIPIGEHVLETACRRLAEWRADGHSALMASVNVSPVQLRHAGIVETVERVLDASALPGRALALEITEGALLEAGAHQLETLERLRALGVLIALDDFGTGYSALGYLRQFPIDTLKIDRSFVDGIGSDPGDWALVQAILTMGHGLGVHCVAEGIETTSQAALLHQLGCPSGQGFLYARPVPADELDFPEIAEAAEHLLTS